MTFLHLILSSMCSFDISYYNGHHRYLDGYLHPTPKSPWFLCILFTCSNAHLQILPRSTFRFFETPLFLIKSNFCLALCTNSSVSVQIQLLSSPLHQLIPHLLIAHNILYPDFPFPLFFFVSLYLLAFWLVPILTTITNSSVSTAPVPAQPSSSLSFPQLTTMAN